MTTERERAIEALGIALHGSPGQGPAAIACKRHAETAVDALTAHIAHVIGGAEADPGRPICDTPGCGRPIPRGGEGHPEICPTCLECLRVNGHRAASPAPAPPASDERRWWIADGAPEDHAYPMWRVQERREDFVEHLRGQAIEVVPAARAEAAELDFANACDVGRRLESRVRKLEPSEQDVRPSQMPDTRATGEGE